MYGAVPEPSTHTAQQKTSPALAGLTLTSSTQFSGTLSLTRGDFQRNATTRGQREQRAPTLGGETLPNAFSQEGCKNVRHV